MKSAQKALAVPYHEQSDAGRVIMIPMTVLYGKNTLVTQITLRMGNGNMQLKLLTYADVYRAAQFPFHIEGCVTQSQHC